MWEGREGEVSLNTTAAEDITYVVTWDHMVLHIPKETTTGGGKEHTEEWSLSKQHLPETGSVSTVLSEVDGGLKMEKKKTNQPKYGIH